MSRLVGKILDMYRTPEGKMKLFRILFYISTAFMLLGFAIILSYIF
ncbi:MAG: hypothetical protein ACE5IJ_07040 [Thermoplasmata archaeon]